MKILDFAGRRVQWKECRDDNVMNSTKVNNYNKK